MFRRNKLIALGVGVLCLILLVVLPNTVGDKIKMMISHIYSPPLHAEKMMTGSTHSVTDQVKSRDELAKENDQLRSEISQLQFQNAQAQEVFLENDRLHRMLLFKNSSRLRLLPALVIGRDTSNWWRSIRIDRGANDGITVNTVIVTPQGLVGRVINVGPSESQVLLILDRSCKVSGVIQASREPGLVMGDATDMGANPRCVMTFISRDAKIEMSAPVVTSGLGGVFPPGLNIGTIAATMHSDAAGLYQEVQIKPVVNFRTLEEVFVVMQGAR